MADLALTAAQIEVVYPDRAEIYTKTAAETITAGQALFQDTNGKVQLADANAGGEQQCRFIALEGGGSGQAITVLRRGHVYGYTITQAYDAPIYLSDTVGALADAAGTMTVPLGIVDGVDQGGTITKILYFDARWRDDYS
jgi:hypothetical protein